MRHNDKVNPSSDQSLISPNNIAVQSSIEGFENIRKDQRNQNNLILRQILPSSTKKGEITPRLGWPDFCLFVVEFVFVCLYV